MDRVTLPVSAIWAVSLADWDVIYWDGAWSYISSEERSYIVRCLDTAERMRRMVGRLLVHWVAASLTGTRPTDVSLIPDPRGKPIIARTPALYFNLSHSGEYVLAVFGVSEVGIDIESKHRVESPLLHYALTSDEYGYVMHAADEGGVRTRFVKVWTRKESYFKAIGTGLRGAWREISFVAHQLPRQQIDEWRFYEYDLDPDYMVVACVTDPCQPPLRVMTVRSLMEELDTFSLSRSAGP